MHGTAKIIFKARALAEILERMHSRHMPCAFFETYIAHHPHTHAVAGMQIVTCTSCHTACTSHTPPILCYELERAVVKVEAPPPIVRRSPVRREVVEVRREVVKAAAPTIKHTVHRVEEKKRTEEVERRVLRKERRHKSRRMHRSHHSSSGGGAHQQEYNYGSWGGGSRGGYRSSSASRASRGAYMNGHGYGGGGGTMERHLPITYEGGGGGTRSVRSGGGGFDSSASDRYYAGGGGGGGGARLQQNGGGGVAHQQQQQHARYGSLSDSLRHGDLKYAPNGELRHNGTATGGNTKAHRVHKAHSTRDVFYRDDGGGADGGSHYATFHRRGEPFVEFPPTLDRRSEQWRGGPAPEPPPHRQQRGVAAADEFSGRALQKARSYADWEEGPPRGGAYGHPAMYDDDMARLESEFRDARLMRIPGNMDEKEQYHREIPGGYEAYSRETKAHADHRKMDGEHAHPGDFRRESQRP
uniref:Uncharacterized protein n=1 Tax=Globodera rostochiensis TaxID=31243 RepID=A0A914GW99_GLORO